MEIGRCMRSLDFSQSYLDKKIGWAKLTEILDSIRYAPSAGDLQNWKLVVVKEEETKKEIAKMAKGKDDETVEGSKDGDGDKDVSGTEGEEYEDLARHTIAFSPDGKHLA